MLQDCQTLQALHLAAHKGTCTWGGLVCIFFSWAGEIMPPSIEFLFRKLLHQTRIDFPHGFGKIWGRYTWIYLNNVTRAKHFLEWAIIIA